jgi:SpoVK/Ycf46/Vps4 family AAA+-type ATPase
MNEEARSLLHQFYKHYVEKYGLPSHTPPYKDIKARLYLLSDEERECFVDMAIDYLNGNEAERKQVFIANPSKLREFEEDRHEDNLILLQSFTEKYDDSANIKRLIVAHPKIKEILEKIENEREPVKIHQLQPIASIAEKLNLSQTETYLLNVMAITTYDEEFIRGFPLDTKLDRGRYVVTKEYLKIACNFTDKEMGLLLSIKGKLRRLKVIEMSARCIQINPVFKDYFLEESDLHIEGERIDLSDTPELKTFKIPQASLDLAVNLLKAPGNTSILLAGAPGTGKTTLAKALAKKAGLTPWILPSSDNLELEQNFRESILATALYLHSSRDTVLIVDEADSIISTSMGFSFAMHAKEDRKAWLNQLLDTHQAKVIFICNKSQVDESTMRRFKLTLNFNPAGPVQRNEFWKELSRKHELNYLTDTDLKDFSERFDLSMGVVAQALNDVARMSSNEPKDTLEQLLTHQLKGMKGSKPSKSKSNPYDTRFVKTNISLESLVQKTIKLSQRGHGRLAYLFTGAPGTGKTAFARHLAREAGFELLIKSYADLTSKYVGDSEKLIQKAFREAEEQGMGLFIDEVDSLLQNRASANRQWEVTQVNQFLTALEDFEGLFIAATNFKDHLDPAAMRRFTDVVEFTSPDVDASMLMVKEMLKDVVSTWPEDQVLKEELSKLSLNPGHIHAIRQSLQFENNVSWEVVGRRLNTHKNKKILGI